MKYIFMLLLYFVHVSLFAYPIDFTQWHLMQGGDELKLYSHNKKKHYKLSIQKKEAYYSDWDKAPAKKVYEDIVATKKKMLSFLGITKWQVKSKSWKPGKKVSVLDIEGTYLNSRQQKVKFHEIHEFKRGEKTQYLFTQVISSK